MLLLITCSCYKIQFLTSDGDMVGTIGLRVGVVVGLRLGAAVGSGVPQRLPGGSALNEQTCCLNQSIPLDILE